MNHYERIKALRIDKDISQNEIAQLINVSQQTYSDYENNITHIPLDALIALAKYYDVDMNYICGLTNIKRKFPR